MAVTVELQNTGDPAVRSELIAEIEHALGDRAGEWKVSIVGTRASAHWAMKIEGPAGFERSYTLDGSSGEHHPAVIRQLLLKLLPARS